MDVNDEYRKALRTRSYIDVWTRIHRHLPRRSATASPRRRPRPQTPTTQEQPENSVATCNTTSLTPTPRSSPDSAATCNSPLTPTSRSSLPSASSSPFFSYSCLPEYLFESRKEVADLIGAVRDPNLRALFLDYFDATLQACNICGSLLRSIHQLRSEHRTIQRLLGATAAGVDREGLASYVGFENPLSSLRTIQFRRVHDVYESLIRRLVFARNRTMRRARLARLVKRASAVTLVAACGALTTAVLVVAPHAVAVLAVAGGPALVGPFSEWVKRRRRRAGLGRLAGVGAQLDAAARGSYIMIRDMETMSRMVARLHDEVEHRKEVVRLFIRSGEGWVLQELAEKSSGGGGGGGFSVQLDELEEHVYWCLLTINRIRGLVAREIAADGSSPLAPAKTSGSSMHG